MSEQNGVLFSASNCDENDTINSFDAYPPSCWFVMRDLKRRNSKSPAYKQLAEVGFEVFTPMKFVILENQGQRVCEQVPFIQDLLFVLSTREQLDPIVDKTATLQYRYMRGGTYCEPMTVERTDMERFINAVKSAATLQYYLPEEIDHSMYGRKIRIIGGALDGCDGFLLKARGSRKKHIIIELPGYISATIEVNPQYIQLI